MVNTGEFMRFRRLCLLSLTISFRAPSSRYLNIGKRTLLEGSYLTRPSPCGANCTYTLTFAAPGLQCERDSPNLGLEGKMLNLYGNVSRSEYGTMPQWRGERANFLAAPYRTNVTESEDRHTALYKFDLTYHDRATKSLKNTSCTTVDARYTANITYQNSVQTVLVDVVNGNALNATILSINSLFYNVIQSSDPTATNLTWDNSALRAFSDESLSNLYHGIQLCAIRDTLVNPLSGSISSFGTMYQCILITRDIDVSQVPRTFSPSTQSSTRRRWRLRSTTRHRSDLQKSTLT